MQILVCYLFQVNYLFPLTYKVHIQGVSNKVDNFEMALNLAKRREVCFFINIHCLGTYGEE